MAEVYGVPVEIPAVSVLAAIASMSRKCIYSEDCHLNYSQLWIMIVARSGVGKTKPLHIAFQPVLEADKHNWDIYCREKNEYDRKIAAAKQKDKERLVPPVYRHRLVSDTTPEALFKKVYENDGITIFRDELAGWFKDFGRYAKSGEVQNYLSMFDNTPIQLSRKTDGHTFIANPYLSIVGTIQPEVLKSVLKQEQMEFNGMAQRFLFAFPDNQNRAYLSSEKIDGELNAYYMRLIESINDLGDGKPVKVTYTDGAWDAIRNFDKEITDRTNASPNDYLSAMYSKMEVHLFRLILVLWYVERYETQNLSNNFIDAPLTDKGIRLCKYFLSCGEKVFDLMQENETRPAITNERLLRMLAERYRIKSQSKLADALGISQQAISKAFSKSR